MCRSSDRVFLSCSLACLERHQTAAHPQIAGATSAERARVFQREMNRGSMGDWQRYAGHRRQVTDLVSATAVGPNLCVFGAGNASDIDLERLAKELQSIHLVDSDPEALERARERLPRAAQAKIVLHDLDLTGMLDRLDDWSAELPNQPLASLAVELAEGLVARLGTVFDTTVSTCVLSQLLFPFQRMWARTAAEWASLEAIVTIVHLTTLAGALRPQGRGLLVFDVLSSMQWPPLADLNGLAGDALGNAVGEGLPDDVPWRARPEELLEVMEVAPGISELVESPRLTGPWLWDLGDATQLVYAIVFGRRG